jgi:outer membrane protein assembly factor BamB
VFSGGELRTLDAGSGDILARQPAPQLWLRGGFVDAGRLFAHLNDGSLGVGAFDLRTGSVVWKVPATVLLEGLTSEERVVVFHSDDQTLVAVDADIGTERWRASVGAIGVHCDLFGREVPGAARGGSIAVAELLLVAVEAHHVLAFDLHTGASRWDCRVETVNPGSLSAGDDGRLFVLGEGRLETLDAVSGAIRNRLDLAEEQRRHHCHAPFSSMGVTRDYLYFADFGRSVFALHKQRGTIAWVFTAAAPIPAANPPTPVGDRLYVVDMKGNLYVFQDESATSTC